LVRNCANCGAEFYTRWSQSKYCMGCRNKNYIKFARQKKGTGTGKRTRTAKPVTVNCAVCGGEFTALSKKALDCPNCKKDAVRAKQRETARKNKKPPKSLVDPMMDYEQPKWVPKCPFWTDSMPPKTIGCEGGRRLKFETSQERLSHLHQYCAKNPGYMECPYAGELLEKYEKGEQA